MLLKHSLLSLLCALEVAWALEPSACFSPDAKGKAGYEACCAKQGNGKGTVGGVVFQYTCQTFLRKGNDYGTAHRGVSSAGECAQLCAADSSCLASSWGSAISQCFLFSSKGYIRYTPNPGFLILEKTPEEPEKPDRAKDCQDLVDAGKKEGEAQCTTEKDKLRQEGEEALRECQKQKQAAVAESKTQCATEKDMLRQEGQEALRECQKQKEAAVAESKTQCEKEKDELRQQAEGAAQKEREQCEKDKSQLRQERDDALQKCKSDCEAEKEQLRQQGTDAAKQCESDKAGLQQQLQTCQDKQQPAKPTDTTEAQDPKCRDNSWQNMCGGVCQEETFTLAGVVFKKKCFVRTVMAQEVQVYHRSSLLECLEKDCAPNSNCLGVGWRPWEVGHCHVHMSIGHGLRTAYNPHEHLIYAKDRVTPMGL
ncbi:uncharacterized protein Aud_004537 [Aspergillus udagawae]|uniref:Apple domain-containing protein n=1 Tax=Aspergillus udagawae TaxID=91492 RepID=A0A8E0QSB8_9EURO|nr:uncharacterized protein Aud_004537 [Aspergillus udagawae]GIC88146.1 hypothetical protein Aud_004537 [Aspergillus udagawae]